MLKALQELATNIAALRDEGRKSGNTRVELIANLMAARFTLMLDDCAQRDGALNGEMPWLLAFRDRPSPSSSDN